MNTTAVQVEDIVEAKIDQSEEPCLREALKELSSIELAYVGGGQYIASFV
jgi:hypothetical protein